MTAVGRIARGSASRARISKAAAAFAIIAGGVLLAALVGLSGIRVMRVSSGSMMPAVRPGDWVLQRRLDGNALSRVERGDIVVFNFPTGSRNPAIKRVLGLPGDRVAIRGNAVAVNGRIVTEGTPAARGEGVLRTELVSRDALFLLGDNMSSSLDSRNFGAVPGREITGIVFFLLRPWMVWLGLGAAAAIFFAAWSRRWTDLWSSPA